MVFFRIFLSISLILACSGFLLGQATYKVLIMDGQSDHNHWKESTQKMKAFLEETGLFVVETARNYPSEGGALDSFKPDFNKYDVVVSNYNGYPWPEDIRKGFEAFVSGGGGLVIVHAANNAFPDWSAYNKMIGVGSGRNEKDGPMVFYDEAQNKLVLDNGPGKAPSHTDNFPVKVKIRSNDHPITAGLPPVWMHEQDQIYNELRGPAQQMEVLATAHSPKDKKGSGRHEAVVMVINYGDGRVFHTTLGHDPESQEGVGFIALLQRGTEWAASGKVTQEVPDDFPGPEQGSKRP